MKNQMLITIEPQELQNLMKTAIGDYFKENPVLGSQQNSLMTIAEAANLLNCSIPTLYAKVSQKKIPFSKRGKRLYFSQSDLIAWVEGK